MVLIEEFPLDDERVVTLELESLNSRTNGAKLVGSSYDRFGGIVHHDLPWTKVVMLKGTVLGDSDSQVFLGFGGG
ncbi:MAG: hypothetical protein QF444_02290, partial [Phycisphaerales bacterium]|nr:hypothetical protein [Phycisphaerales bacterium]